MTFSDGIRVKSLLRPGYLRILIISFAIILSTAFSANADPYISLLSPSSVVAGGTGFDLQVSGLNFTPDSDIAWNGVIQDTTYLSDHLLRASIGAVDIAYPGSATVTVWDNGMSSNSLELQILSPIPPTPSITSLTPVGAIAGSSGFDLQIYGFNFLPDSTVSFEGSAIFTIFLSSHQLRATVSSALLTTPGEVDVVVNNGGGVMSDPYEFEITSSNAVPEPSALILLGFGLIGLVGMARKKN